MPLAFQLKAFFAVKYCGDYPLLNSVMLLNHELGVYFANEIKLGQ
jgi:hypothetical protein